MGKRFFFLHVNIFSERDWARFGCDYITSQGYEVIPIEIMELIQPDKYKNMATDTFRSIANVKKVTNYDQLNIILRSVQKHDIVICTMNLSSITAPIFKALTDQKVDYCCMSLGGVPSGYFRHMSASLGICDFLKIKLSDVGGYLYRLKVFLRNATSKEVSWFDLRSPKWWIRAGSRYSLTTMQAPKMWQSKVISTKSFDTEIIDEVLEKCIQYKNPSGKPYAVFIDDGLLDHPDFCYEGEEFPVSWNAYATGLKKLFAQIENNHGLEVIVAGHPKSQNAHANGLFGKSVFIQGKTAELVAGSELVIVSCSTAISFAVRARKPIIIYTSDELEKDDFFREFITRMSSWFGSRRINIDMLEDGNVIEIPKIHEAYYREYELSFLEDNQSCGLPIWEAVLLSIEQKSQKST